MVSPTAQNCAKGRKGDVSWPVAYLDMSDRLFKTSGREIMAWLVVDWKWLDVFITHAFQSALTSKCSTVHSFTSLALEDVHGSVQHVYAPCSPSSSFTNERLLICQLPILVGHASPERCVYGQSLLRSLMEQLWRMAKTFTMSRMQ